MEGLSIIQRDLQTKIINGFSNFKKTPKPPITVPYVETRLEMLESYWSKYDANHHEILLESHKKDTTEDPYFTQNLYDTVENSYIEYKTTLRETLRNFKAETTTASQKGNYDSTQVHTNEGLNVKLPKIDLPQFSGKYMEWTTFHNLFDTLIHKNQSLARVQKLYYLKSHLTGEAEQLLRQIPITEANYEHCWQQLKKRYNNKRYIANCNLTRLVGQKSLTVETSQGVKQLLDTTNECIHALSNIGVKTETWDLLIIHLISLKLDNETRKQWEHKLSEQSEELPTWQEFNCFLESRFRALEFLEPVSSRGPLKVRDKEQIKKTKVFSVTTGNSCPFCTERHFLFRCKSFSKESSDKRREFIQKNRLCFNCFRKHSVIHCRNHNSCHRCGRRHHSLLHQGGYSGSKPTARTSSQEPEPIANISSNFAEGTISSPGPVLLATALVKINHKGVYHTFRALLDQGSQASFITDRVVQSLGLHKTPVKDRISGLEGDQLNIGIKHAVHFNLQSICTSFNCNVKAYILKSVSSTLPSKNVDINNWPELSGLSLAGPQYGKPNRVDMLLGADLYGLILSDGLIRNPSGTITAQNTQLGWILSGLVCV